MNIIKMFSIFLSYQKMKTCSIYDAIYFVFFCVFCWINSLRVVWKMAAVLSQPQCVKMLLPYNVKLLLFHLNKILNYVGIVDLWPNNNDRTAWSEPGFKLSNCWLIIPHLVGSGHHEVCYWFMVIRRFLFTRDISRLSLWCMDINQGMNQF